MLDDGRELYSPNSEVFIEMQKIEQHLRTRKRQQCPHGGIDHRLNFNGCTVWNIVRYNEIPEHVTWPGELTPWCRAEGILVHHACHCSDCLFLALALHGHGNFHHKPAGESLAWRPNCL